VLTLETGSKHESGYWVWKISGTTEEFIVYHGDLMDVEE